jgi:hypothetical protein
MLKSLLRVDGGEGEAASRALLGWCREENLWLRRSSVVAFVSLAKLPDEQARAVGMGV